MKHASRCTRLPAIPPSRCSTTFGALDAQTREVMQDELLRIG
jgi:hypothetical protein